MHTYSIRLENKSVTRILSSISPCLTTQYLKPVKRRSIFHRDWPLSLSPSLSLSRLIYNTHTHTHRILGHFVVIIEVPSGSSSLALTFYCHAHVWPIPHPWPHPCVIDGTLSWKGRCLLLNERSRSIMGHRPMGIVNERINSLYTSVNGKFLDSTKLESIGRKKLHENSSLKNNTRAC